MNMIRIGFPIISSNVWMGGYNYLLSLTSALSIYEPKQVQVVLFCGIDTPDEDLLPFQAINNIHIVQSKAFSKSSLYSGLLQALLFGKNSQVSKLFSDEKINVIFEPAVFYGKRLNIPGIAWMPDFQHRKMPHLFGQINWLKRDIGFKMQINAERTILLSSDTASKDCEKFYTIKPEKIKVLKFPALISPKLFEFNTSKLKDLYQLPEKFAYIPNQFWQHKNHKVILNALKILKENGDNITIICTGNTHDSRNHHYFPSIQSEIKKLNLSKNFKVLGLIPREHAVGLLRTCSLLINPSFFEGWNTSVEEAKILNIPMLLSNIEVHQEQAGNKATYFPPDDAEVLAQQLLKQMSIVSAPLHARVLVQNSEKILKNFASEFTTIAQNA